MLEMDMEIIRKDQVQVQYLNTAFNKGTFLNKEWFLLHTLSGFQINLVCQLDNFTLFHHSMDV